MARFKEFQLDGNRKPVLIKLDDISFITPDIREGRTLVHLLSGKQMVVVHDYLEMAREIQAQD